MLALLVLEGIGACVSKGVFAMYDTDGNGAGFISAKEGGSPVAVGPL